MKLINILEAIANNNLKDKTRLKVCSSSNREAFILEFDISYPGILWCIDENDETYKFNYHIDFMRILNYEVTIIEGGFIEEDPEDKEITEHHDIFDYFTGYSFGETNKELLQQLEHNFQIVNEELDYLINKINKD